MVCRFIIMIIIIRRIRTLFQEDITLNKTTERAAMRVFLNLSYFDTNDSLIYGPQI